MAERDDAREWLIHNVADAVTIDKLLAHPEKVCVALGGEVEWYDGPQGWFVPNPEMEG